MLFMERPTAVLKKAGLINQLPIRIEPRIVRKLQTGKDGLRKPLTDDDILRLPELVTNPIAVLKEKNERGSLIVITSLMVDDAPVIVAINPTPVDEAYAIDVFNPATGKKIGTQPWRERFTPMKSAFQVEEAT